MDNMHGSGCVCCMKIKRVNGMRQPKRWTGVRTGGLAEGRGLMSFHVPEGHYGLRAMI